MPDFRIFNNIISYSNQIVFLFSQNLSHSSLHHPTSQHSLFLPLFSLQIFLSIIQSRMHSQKKGTAHKRARSSHSLKKPAQQNLHKYGPLIMKKPPINEIIGYTLSHQPMGLKKHIRSSSCSTSDKDKESYFDLALRTGELNFFRRFKNVRYLENFSSKKNMYNICEETVISRLMNQVSEVNQQSRICKSRKRMEVRF